MFIFKNLQIYMKSLFLLLLIWKLSLVSGGEDLLHF